MPFALKVTLLTAFIDFLMLKLTFVSKVFTCLHSKETRCKSLGCFQKLVLGTKHKELQNMRRDNKFPIYVTTVEAGCVFG